MSLIDKQLQEVWNALRADSLQRHDALRAIRIKHLRGIRDLRVPFQYPVSVLAGPNGCGKSTVLFACACAYRDPERGTRELVPSSLFPNFVDPQRGTLSDTVEHTELEFDYVRGGEGYAMAWKRGKSWNRSFMGRKGGRQPERSLYLRTLANLTNPSEVRGLLQLARKPFHTEELTSDLLILAHRILPRRYRNLSVISAQTRTLLFARVDDLPAGYSEFHMSSGERAILRISKDISALQGALVLIDEVEAGLHPYTQQQAMLELQRIALRKKLQVVVASHSPVVLDSVPPEARIFLDRDADTAEVRVMPVFRDIFQKALYGQTRDRLSVLCEDAVAEEIIRGVLDVLNAEMALRHDDVVVGRNTGRDDFPGHVRTLGAVDKLGDFLLVLDGDSRHLEATIKAVAADFGHSARPLFLPGEEPPERWIWNALEQHAEDYAPVLGSTSADLKARMREIDRLGEGAVRQRHAAKDGLFALSDELNSTVENVARSVARTETKANRGDMARFRIELGEQIDKWRQDGP